MITDNAHSVPVASYSSLNRLHLVITLAAIIAILMAANQFSSKLANGVSSLYFIILPAAVVVFAFVKLRRIEFKTREWKVVSLFVLFAIMRSAAEMLWTYHENVVNEMIFPSSADLIWLCGFGVLAIFLLAYMQPIRKSIQRNAKIIAGLLSLIFLIPSIIMVYQIHNESDLYQLSVAFAFPVADTMVLYPIILGMISLRQWYRNEFFVLLFCAILGFIISDTLFLTIFNEYESGNLIDFGWLAGYVLMSYAVLRYQPLTKGDLYRGLIYVNDKKIVNSVNFETMVRFVIPFAIVAISITSIIVVINDQYLDRVYQAREPDSFTVDLYVVVGISSAASVAVLFVNRRLYRMVKQHTADLELERDILRLQVREKNEALEKSAELEKKLERMLETISSSEQKYRNLYDGSNDLYYTINTKGTILDCNSSFARSLASSKEELIGKSIFDYVEERSIYEMNMAFASWIDTGSTVDREIWLKRKNGSTFPTLFSMSNLYDKDGDLVGSNTTMKDITTQKMISDQLSGTYVQLQKTEKLKDEFMAMVSRELKTPLVPIVGYSDILLSEKIGPLNEDQKKRLRVVKDCTVRLQMLINDIFDVQKIELGRLRLNKADHRLSDIIKETIEEFMPTFEIEQIKIRTILDENILCSCDKKRVQQVLSNLIKNSIDFCPDNEGQILIRLYVEDNNAKIIVTDNGKGIMKEDISNLFGKFYQINTNTTREHGGTGLGLCICKGIIENHGGRIWIESEGIGKGVQVSMILPQITADKTSWMDEDLETDFIMGHNYLQDTQEAAMQALL